MSRLFWAVLGAALGAAAIVLAARAQLPVPATDETTADDVADAEVSTAESERDFFAPPRH